MRSLPEIAYSLLLPGAAEKAGSTRQVSSRLILIVDTGKDCGSTSRGTFQ